jgi:SAM-dependent methyltransferase
VKPDKDLEYFLELQAKTGWGKTLVSFAKWCAPEPGWISLDFGCGPGLFPAILAEIGCYAVGVDLDVQMYKPIRIHTMVVVGDVFNQPFKHQGFNLNTAVNV